MNPATYDIYKAAGIIIRDRKLLVVKEYNKSFFIAPGGKLEPNETPEKALVRELFEELQMTIQTMNISPFGTFYSQAIGQESKVLRMDTFLVSEWSGEIVPTHEIEQLLWIDSISALEIELGSIFEKDVLPELVKRQLVD